MRPERKGARDALKAIPTKAELAARLEASTLTDQQRQAVWLVYGEGMTRVKAAAVMSEPVVGQHGHSVELGQARAISG